MNFLTSLGFSTRLLFSLVCMIATCKYYVHMCIQASIPHWVPLCTLVLGWQKVSFTLSCTRVLGQNFFNPTTECPFWLEFKQNQPPTPSNLSLCMAFRGLVLVFSNIVCIHIFLCSSEIKNGSCVLTHFLFPLSSTSAPPWLADVVCCTRKLPA